MQTFLKTGFSQISLAAKKIWAVQNLGAGGGGVAAPLPVRTPMDGLENKPVPGVYIVGTVQRDVWARK